MKKKLPPKKVGVFPWELPHFITSERVAFLPFAVNGSYTVTYVSTSRQTPPTVVPATKRLMH